MINYLSREFHEYTDPHIDDRCSDSMSMAVQVQVHEAHRGRCLDHPSFAMLWWSNNVSMTASSSWLYYCYRNQKAAAAIPSDMISRSPVAFDLSLLLSYVRSEIFRLIDSVLGIDQGFCRIALRLCPQLKLIPVTV